MSENYVALGGRAEKMFDSVLHSSMLLRVHDELSYLCTVHIDALCMQYDD